MKNLIKFAVGAAIAGALVNMLMKQRATRFRDDPAFDPALDDDSALAGNDAFGRNDATDGGEVVGGIEAVTLSGDMIGGETTGDRPTVPRDEWLEIPTVNEPKH